MRPQSSLSLLLALCLVSTALANEWQAIRNCSLIENESNDGDSFHVKADGEERIFRLYFVDTPEADADDSRGRSRGGATPGSPRPNLPSIPKTTTTNNQH